MRWDSSIFLLAACLAAWGCKGGGPGEATEHLVLERALIDFCEAPPEHRRSRLEALRRLEFSSDRVRAVRETCSMAYEAFFSAMDRLAEVKDQAAMVEAESAKAIDPSPEETAAISRMQASALEGTREVGSALDHAEAMVARCARARARLAREPGE